MRKSSVPEYIRKVGFDFSWSEQKVWSLNLPVEDMSLKELEWHFELPFWNFADGDYSLRPIDVMKNPEKFQEEYERVMNSDISYPIDIMQNKGRWVILDGLHRLLKHKVLGHGFVKVRKVPREMIDRIKI